MKFDQPGLEATLLKPTNECGVEKLVCTFVKVMMMMLIIFIMFLKPTVLPYSHLFDVDACAKFVSDFVYYNPDRSEAIVLGKLYWYSHFPSIEIELETLFLGLSKEVSILHLAFCKNRLETALR